MVYLVAGKILRTTVVRFEVSKSGLRLLLMKTDIMHVEKNCCE